ncbi:histone H2A [Gregarina niphandrodes]|uniref:Histone H2A n=1 Tax=Gregarina niphandrodes TaxID=110365 RepID=A0A023BCE8_GRENI|nr:histone H2A [Gregarina niphandrodes]EZG83564.1 histone H2A [Gregarina niphandrodes]|eukprot:XP_011128925.1 histone H2A [Gregarina niphandrodes]
MSGKTTAKAASKTRSQKAGLIFPVGRIARHLRNGRYAKRIGAAAPIFMAAVLEYLTTEVLHLAGTMANEQGKLRITPRFIQLAVRTDEELNDFLGNVIIASGGVCSETAVATSLSTPSTASSKKKKKPAEEDDDEDEDEEEEEEVQDSQRY